MKITHSFKNVLLAVTVGAATLPGHMAQAATINWTNTSGGNWSVAANWNPNQLPTNSDTALITTPGTYTVTFDLANSIYVATNVGSLILGAGGGVAGVQTFAITNRQFTFNNLVVTNGGVFTAQAATIGQGPTITVNGGVSHFVASTIGSTLVVTNGGAVTSTNGSISTLMVANGGVLNAGGTGFGQVTVAAGGHLAVVDAGFNLVTVAQGGVLDITHDPASIFTVTGLSALLSNSGAINLTNAPVYIYNYEYQTYGGLINQPGGVINMHGNGAIEVNVGYPPNAFLGYIVNHGVITQFTGTNTVSAPYFDVTQGTMTNLSGTMMLGTYQTNLAGTYFAAAGATIQFNAINDGTNFVTPGTPLVLAGSGQYQFVSGDLKYPTNTIPNLTLLGNLLALGPTFQGEAITNLIISGMTLSNTLPVTGFFAATNSAIQGDFAVAGGGIFTESNSATYGSVTVANGGLLNASAGVYIVGPLTLQHGGVLNVGGALSVFASLTNSGIINLTNAPITISGGGILNQSGGLLDFWGNGANILASYVSDYFINKGMITQSVGAITNRISVFGFDSSLGTVTNLARTLVLGTFYTNLAGTYNAAAGATIQFSGGTAAAPITNNVNLVFSGGGQFQFISGFLYLPTTAPKGLQLLGGTLALGPAFQGGAITSLALNGITLSNQLSSAYLVASGGNFSLSNSAVYGSLTVAGGGTVNALLASLHGPVTVVNGGVLNVIKNGGPNPDLQVFSPTTNSGTINMTNSFIAFMGSNDPLINQPSGVINFADSLGSGQRGSFLTSLPGVGITLYLLNQGLISKPTGADIADVDIPVTNSGVIAALSGSILFHSQWTQLPGGGLNVALNSAADYASFIFSTNSPFVPVGNVPFAGNFGAILNSGYVPTSGTSFSVVSYGSYTGSFSSLNLPASVSWQFNYGSTNFTLVAGRAKPQFGGFNMSGTNLFFTGIGGSPGSNYVVLASTNLTLPLVSWTALATNVFDGSGQFHYTNNVNPARPRQYFIFKLP